MEETNSNINEEGQLIPKSVKDEVINLCDDEIKDSHLSLGPKFVPNSKTIPWMDIVSTTESTALKLEYSNKITEAQNIRKDILRIMKTDKNTGIIYLREKNLL